MLRPQAGQVQVLSQDVQGGCPVGLIWSEDQISIRADKYQGWQDSVLEGDKR